MADAPANSNPPTRTNIGIDLGTSTCSVARLVDDRTLECCPLEGDNLVLPSVLYFGDEIHLGDDALTRGLSSPDRVVEAFKQEMGKAHYTRKILSQWLPPEVLSGFLLAGILKRAKETVGEVGGAVITVPAYFDEKRRQATLEAGRLAGLNVLNIINEPVAAALADLHYQGRLDNREQLSMKTLVYDLGGGTFDVSVLDVQGPEINTLAADGDIRLGGRDFDEKIVEFVAEKFQQHHGIDPRVDFDYAQQLWRLAREAKHTLSTAERTTIVCALADMRLGVEITRSDFEALIDPYIERTLFTLGDTLREAQLDYSDVDQILLVGGSSRIPLVAQRIAEETGITPTQSHEPDLVVSQGAALFASLSQSKRYEPIRLVNVSSHSFGIAGVDPRTNRAVNRVIIPRNSRLPAAKRTKFVTKQENQKSIQIKIVEGDNDDPQYCVPVGTCHVTLTPGLPARTEVLIVMQVGADGTLSVSCRIPSTKDAAHTEIRREGFADLESLAVWRSRLLGGYQRPEQNLPNIAKVPAITSPEEFERDTALKRLDYLCQQLGDRMAEATIPPGALAAQRQFAAAQQEYLVVRHVLERIRHKLASANNPQERSKLQSAAATVKTSLSEVENLLIYSRIAFGWACVAHGEATADFGSEAAEAASLIMGLDSIGEESLAATPEDSPV